MGTFCTSSILPKTALEVEGLKNPDGSLIYGINYTPAYLYGWLTSALTNEFFRPEQMEAELTDIKEMGFNSVRIMSPIYEGLYKLQGTGFTNMLAGYKERYKTFLDICKRLNLTVDVLMPLNAAYDADYAAPNSNSEQIIRFYFELGRLYPDTIILWELANEPDVNTYGLDYNSEINAFKNDTRWNNTVKPFLKWAKETLDALYDANPEVKRIPDSIGALNSSRCDSYDAETFDVLNIHCYRRTTAEWDSFMQQAYSLDNETLGSVRPVVISELGSATMTQPIDDMIQYCVDSGISFYLWSYAAVSNEGEQQGIVDMTGKTRISTLPFEMVKGAEEHFPLSVSSYDITFGGRNVFSTAYYYAIGNTGSDYQYAAEYLYNWARYVVPYYTETYSQVYNSLSGTALQRNKYIVKLASQMARPYIRTYNTYENDNSLGGSESANYYESFTGYNTGTGLNTFRSRFAFNMGKNGTKAILMQDTNNLIIKRAAVGGEYTFEVDVNPMANRTATVGVLCGSEGVGMLNPGLYCKVSREVSDDVKNSSVLSNSYQRPYYLIVYSVSADGVYTQRAAVKLSENEFDQNGYTNVKITYSGNGSTASPLNATVYVGGNKKAEVAANNINSVGPAVNAYPSLCTSTYDSSAAYFDNIKLSNASGVILSDSFEGGKFDYDYLTYSTSHSKEGFNGSQYNNEWLASILDSFVEGVGLAETENLSAPYNVTLGTADDCLNVSWTFIGSGEYGFEIQVSYDNGESYSQLWRTTPDVNSTLIPNVDLTDKTALYRVAVVSKNNELKAFSEGVKIGEGEEYKSKLIAQYKFEDADNLGLDSSGMGNHLTVLMGKPISVVGKAGNGVWFDGVSDLETASKIDFTDRLTDFTISFWAQRSDTAPDGAIAVGTGWRDSAPGIHINLNDDSYFCVGLRESDNSGSWNHYYTGGTAFSQMDFYTVTVSDGGTRLTMYINGKKLTDGVWYDEQSGKYLMNNPDNPFTIGALSNGEGFVGNGFKGIIDEVSVFDGALNQTEVAMLYGSYQCTGDINADGAVNILDLLILKGCMNGKTDGYYISAADFNSNGVIDAADIGKLRKYLLGVITQL